MMSSPRTVQGKKRFTTLIKGVALMATAVHVGSWMRSPALSDHYSTERFLTEEEGQLALPGEGLIGRALPEGLTGDCSYIMFGTACTPIPIMFWNTAVGGLSPVSGVETLSSCTSNVLFLSWGTSPASRFCRGGFQNGVCAAEDCLDMTAALAVTVEPEPEVVAAVNEFEDNVDTFEENLDTIEATTGEFNNDNGLEDFDGEDNVVANPNLAGVNSDPLFIGIRGQVFKFEGKSDTWYANLASDSVQWNLLFNEFDTCPDKENMFVTKASVFLRDTGNQITVGVSDKDKFVPGCKDNTVCLGDGSLSIEINNQVIQSPGVYELADNEGRVVIHNTYAACSRKWYDYEISKKDNLRIAENRALIDTDYQEAAMDLLFKNKGDMLDHKECQGWLDKRAGNGDLFSQNGSWTTIYIETRDISMHMEYRQADEACNSHLIDAWISKVSPNLLAQEWKGILGETRYPKFNDDGSEIDSGRNALLVGKEDANYEVENKYETEFAARSLFSARNPFIVDSSKTVEK